VVAEEPEGEEAPATRSPVSRTARSRDRAWRCVPLECRSLFVSAHQITADNDRYALKVLYPLSTLYLS
jgi:hypothetical protein